MKIYYRREEIEINIQGKSHNKVIRLKTYYDGYYIYDFNRENQKESLTNVKGSPYASAHMASLRKAIRLRHITSNTSYDILQVVK